MIAAESFMGRVLAAFSRRSPGFRPPVTPSVPPVWPDRGMVSPPTPAASPGTPEPPTSPEVGTDRHIAAEPGVTETTARWMTMPPPDRLQQREALLEMAAFFGRARSAAEAIVHGLDRALRLPQIPGIDLDGALDGVHGHDLERALDGALDGALNLDRTHDLDCVVDLATALDFGLDVARSLERAIHRGRSLNRSLSQARSRHGPDRDRCLRRSQILASDLARDLATAQSNLTDAANDFVGADFTTVDPSQVDLAWIRWNNDTRWPSREWAERVRNASVELSLGSGIFVILPEEQHDPAEAALV
jgi:hypothetical protein